MDKFYITTSIAYTNAKPHIGFALELLQADVLARYRRRKGLRVHFLTGTDEHGSKIARAAEKEEKEVQEFVDELSEEFKRLTKDLNISNDDFIRTTDKSRHWPGVNLLWKKIEEAGDIYKKSYKGLYCSGCEVFKREKDLVEGKCPDHGKEPEKVEEENYFFRLSRYSEEIRKLIEKDKIKVIPENRKKEIINFLKEGLEDISVSRSRENLEWGIPVPGDDSQILYVWLDALTNYISAVGYGRDDKTFKDWWPAEFHCVGKDILRFHAIIWIGMLLSAKIELPRNILVHGHITCEGKKMSKSLGNVVDPLELIKEHGTDPVRYYLLKEIPTTGDGDFSLKRFMERYNADLADGVGNLLSRTIALSKKQGVIPGKASERIEKMIREKRAEYEKRMEKCKLNDALEVVWEVVHFADGYIEEKKPWKKGDKSEDTIEDLLFILLFLSETLSPFLPESSEEIKKGVERGEKRTLFPKIKRS